MRWLYGRLYANGCVGVVAGRTGHVRRLSEKEGSKSKYYTPYTRLRGWLAASLLVFER